MSNPLRDRAWRSRFKERFALASHVQRAIEGWSPAIGEAWSLDYREMSASGTGPRPSLRHCEAAGPGFVRLRIGGRLARIASIYRAGGESSGSHSFVVTRNSSCEFLESAQRSGSSDHAGRFPRRSVRPSRTSPRIAQTVSRTLQAIRGRDS